MTRAEEAANRVSKHMDDGVYEDNCLTDILHEEGFSEEETLAGIETYYRYIMGDKSC